MSHDMVLKLNQHPCPGGCGGYVYSSEPTAAGHAVVDWIYCWNCAPAGTTLIVPFERERGW